MSHEIKKETMGLKKKRRRSAKFSYLDPVVPEEDKSSVHRVFCESVSALVKKTHPEPGYQCLWRMFGF